MGANGWRLNVPVGDRGQLSASPGGSGLSAGPCPSLSIGYVGSGQGRRWRWNPVVFSVSRVAFASARAPVRHAGPAIARNAAKKCISTVNGGRNV